MHTAAGQDAKGARRSQRPCCDRAWPGVSPGGGVRGAGVRAGVPEGQPFLAINRASARRSPAAAALSCVLCTRLRACCCSPWCLHCIMPMRRDAHYRKVGRGERRAKARERARKAWS